MKQRSSHCRRDDVLVSTLWSSKLSTNGPLPALLLLAMSEYYLDPGELLGVLAGLFSTSTAHPGDLEGQTMQRKSGLEKDSGRL